MLLIRSIITLHCSVGQRNSISVGVLAWKGVDLWEPCQKLSRREVFSKMPLGNNKPFQRFLTFIFLTLGNLINLCSSVFESWQATSLSLAFGNEFHRHIVHCYRWWLSWFCIMKRQVASTFSITLCRLLDGWLQIQYKKYCDFFFNSS